MPTRDSFPIEPFLPYMRDVAKCEQALHEVNLMWHMIESSARMNCPREAGTILPTMAATRARFRQLEEELVINLAREKLRNAHAALATTAGYIIEIVVRNLFERTADVGFLATDRELCLFVAGITSDTDAVRRRLCAYRDKYTVYDEIILLDTSGRVLVQLDPQSALDSSRDALIARTLVCDTYVETFRASDLCPDKRNALIYSRRLCHPDTGAVIGVLCLSFAFEEEMGRIFSTHGDPGDRSNMLLLDGDNRVIASADTYWMPLGTLVPVNASDVPGLMMFGGREYLVCTISSQGYQGYPGPAGWQGQVMIPVDIAFGGKQATLLDQLAPALANGVLSHAHAFCPPLFGIMRAADSASETIRRVVWNGQVMTTGQDAGLGRLKTILEQISETGARSNALFAESIRDLFDTVLASGLRDTEFVTHLLVDLLDRNLYERANDCRWWALTPELRRLLAVTQRSAGDIDNMTRILATINGLYSVYTCLFVYDRNGMIIASTGEGIGTTIDAVSLGQVTALRTGQDYYVSPFEPSTLYGDMPTYVYHAAIRHPDRDTEVIGGIGIVFDAGPEFSAMLCGGLGGKTETQADTRAFFVDRRGVIIASTDPSRPVGGTLDVDSSFLAPGSGCSTSRIVTHDGSYALVGCTASHGYREFKVSDAYSGDASADVIAVVIAAVGPVAQGSVGNTEPVARFTSVPGMLDGLEFATFYLDNALLAIPAEHVREALPAAGVSPMSIGAGAGCLGILPVVGSQPGMSDDFVWVFDLGAFLSGKPTVQDSRSQIIVVRLGQRSIGLLVTQLHGVGRFDPAQLVATPMGGQATGNGMLVRQVIQAEEDNLLIQVVDLAYLFGVLMAPANAAPELPDNVYALQPAGYSSTGGNAQKAGSH
ncbi:chemotaxis protein CheW [Actimicrobium antarcticum]|uniref:CheW-like domain-containing protein n=1 Tax=Actimicrobium antarcticum TaxID=1051899 RepID=A0ABP7SFR4_9BURK